MLILFFLFFFRYKYKKGISTMSYNGITFECGEDNKLIINRYGENKIFTNVAYNDAYYVYSCYEIDENKGAQAPFFCIKIHIDNRRSAYRRARSELPFYHTSSNLSSIFFNFIYLHYFPKTTVNKKLLQNP